MKVAEKTYTQADLTPRRYWMLEVPSDDTSWYADLLRLVLARLKTDNDRASCMVGYSENEIDESIFDALTYATDQGIQLPKKYRPLVEELFADSDLLAVFEEYVDMKRVFGS